MLIIAFFSLFLIVHRSGFTFGNAMMYHLYNFIGGLMALFIVLIFFYKYQYVFENTCKMGKWLQYIGRNTLAIYMLHYFSCHEIYNSSATFLCSTPIQLWNYLSQWV